MWYTDVSFLHDRQVKNVAFEPNHTASGPYLARFISGGSASPEAHMREQLAIFNALARDYLNIFLLTPETASIQILKLDGYVTTGLDKSKDTVYPYYAICQQYIQERVYAEDREMMRAAMDLDRVLQVLSEKDEYVTSYRTMIDGQIHYYQFKYIRISEDGHIIAGFQNIDAIITKEREQQDILATALAAANQSSHAKSVFLSSMSHDIRTPLNAIMGLTALAADHADDPALVREYLAKVTTASGHLLTLLNDVLDMSHIESGLMKLEDAPLYLPDLFDALYTIVQPNAQEKSLALRFETAELTHRQVIADGLKVKQVLLNLLSNAVKFTTSGGHILFRVREQFDTSPGYAHFLFTVRDDGMGMSPEFLSRIFEPFAREQTATISGIPGSGLGLSIAKSIVDMMGGTLQVRSEQGKGTEFLLSLQFPTTGQRAADAVPGAETVPLPCSAEDSRSVLLVDDNALNREIAAELLERYGFSVDTAENGAAAVEKVRTARPGQYDLVLMDIQMPEMNGYEAARQIRRLPGPMGNIPIFALTANAFEEDKLNALNAGMNGHISKPIDITKLIATIRSV